MSFLDMFSGLTGQMSTDMAIDLERVSDHATNLAGLDEEVEKHHIEPVVIA